MRPCVVVTLTALALPISACEATATPFAKTTAQPAPTETRAPTLTPAPTSTPFLQIPIAQIVCEALNVGTGPGIDYPALGALPREDGPRRIQ